MKASPEKILLVIAVLICAGSAAWTFLLAGSPQRSAAQDAPSSRTAGYTSVASSEPVRVEPAWAPPPPQSEDGLWVYDIFTPPRIYINPETRLFSVIPYTGPVEEAPFGLVLTTVERPVYRLQLEGYVEEDPSDPSKSLIHLHDREAGRSRMMRVGQESPESEFRILGFQLSREMNADGLLERRAELELQDLRTGSRITLRSGQTRYADRMRLHFRSREPADRRFVAEAPGERIEHDGYVYTIVEIDPDMPSVLVERTATDGGSIRRQVLYPESHSFFPPERPASNAAIALRLNHHDSVFHEAPSLFLP